MDTPVGTLLGCARDVRSKAAEVNLAHVSPPVSVWVRWSDREATVFLRGDLDMVSAPDAEESLLRVAELRPAKLVLDLRKLSFMDSAGVSLIIKTRRALPAGCPFVLRSPNRNVSKVLRITGVDRVFTVENSQS